VECAAALPIDTVKFHQLQIIKNTTLARETVTGEDGVMQFRGYPLHLFEVEEYVDLCVEMIETLNRLNPKIAIERFTSQAPADLLLAPRWGLKNYQFTNLLNNRLAAR
jgi:hypothetical protein